MCVLGECDFIIRQLLIISQLVGHVVDWWVSQLVCRSFCLLCIWLSVGWLVRWSVSFVLLVDRLVSWCVGHSVSWLVGMGMEWDFNGNPKSGSSIHCLQWIELEFRNVGFCGGRKTGVPGEKKAEKTGGKTLGARTRTNNKLNQHIG